MEWKWYRYFEPASVGLDFEGLMEDLRAAPEGSVVVLHGACFYHPPKPYLKTLAQRAPWRACAAPRRGPLWCCVATMWTPPTLLRKDPSTEGLMEDLRAPPEGSVVVLHGDFLDTPNPGTVPGSDTFF